MDRPDGSPTAVDVVLRPEWAAIEATDLNLSGLDFNLPFNGFATFSYLVPAGKRLYVTHLSSSCLANAAGSGDLNQFCQTQLWIGVAQEVTIGSNGGGLWPLSKPLVLTAGQTLIVYAISFANHAVDVVGGALGYEVPV